MQISEIASLKLRALFLKIGLFTSPPKAGSQDIRLPFPSICRLFFLGFVVLLKW